MIGTTARTLPAPTRAWLPKASTGLVSVFFIAASLFPLFTTVASCRQTDRKKADLYGLVVGVSRYKHPQIPKLDSAKKDAEDFVGFLKSQRKLYNNIHVKLLVDESATKARIERVLYQGFRLAGENDRLLFYFSGYGLADCKERKGYFLIAYDTDPNRVTSTGVFYSPKQQAVVTKARQSACIIDICRSVVFGEASSPSEVVTLSDLLRDSGNTSNRIAIVSSRSRGLSKKYARLRNGVFTHFLLEGLRGEGDFDNDGIITLTEAYDYASSHTRVLTGGAQQTEFGGREDAPFTLWDGRDPKQAGYLRPDSAKGDLHCLAIGVSEYKNPKIPDLKYAAKDARDFVKFVKSQRQLYKKVRVKLLVDERATKANIEKWLSKGCVSAGKDDTLLLFFSGHGLADPNREDEYFVAAHDTDPFRVASTGVLLSGMRLIKKVEARRALLIADTCMAGASVDLQRESGGVSLADFVREFRNRPNRMVIASSSTPESSVEDPGFRNGVFTHFLLKGLRGEADSDEDGVVTVTEAYHYVSSHTRDFTRGTQNPEFEGRADGPFALSVVARDLSEAQ